MPGSSCDYYSGAEGDWVTAVLINMIKRR